MEGFIRQVIGWREFIRGIYQFRSVPVRTRNFWAFDRPIPNSFYDGTTGIAPVDRVIRTVLKEGYCHHIERLSMMARTWEKMLREKQQAHQVEAERFLASLDG